MTETLSAPLVDEMDVRRALVRACAVNGVKAFAKLHGESEYLVQCVIRGQKAPSDRILKAVGYERVIRYRKEKAAPKDGPSSQTQRTDAVTCRAAGSAEQAAPVVRAVPASGSDSAGSSFPWWWSELCRSWRESLVMMFGNATDDHQRDVAGKVQTP